MVLPSAPELQFRFGCPLALLVTGTFIAALEALVPEKSIVDDWLFFGGFTGVPFAILALARVHDWVAWLLAVALTGGFWAYFFSSSPRSTDFGLGFAMTIAPLVIAGVCLATAGMRNRIAWAPEKGDPVH